ncbi:Coiled-coil domain-containing protein [Intoshia linei]|uniref:Coiled-coil domain-containing protein n=1 Tax=Intoshia linei TaxID=1819745 RepID=A0A177B7P8_9BILA|nr:Coiled-coil domain-containing protein [Intoshia linei]
MIIGKFWFLKPCTSGLEPLTENCAKSLLVKLHLRQDQALQNMYNHGKVAAEDVCTRFSRVVHNGAFKRGPDDSFFKSQNFKMSNAMSTPTKLRKSSSSKKHTNLPKEAIEIMMSWLREHKTNPYPNEIEKSMLVQATRLTMNQINYWFTNARRRILPKWALAAHKAQNGEASKNLFIPNASMLKNVTLSNDFNLENVAVFTMSDIDRLNHLINDQKNEKKKIKLRKIELEKFKNTSHQRIKNWKNITKDLNERKLLAKQVREAKLEEESKKVDELEYQHREKLRNEMLLEARKKIYYERDYVKSFHSSIRLADTLDERKQQLELKKLLKGRNEEVYEINEKIQNEWIDKYDARENEKRAKMIDGNLKNVKYLTEQIDSHVLAKQRVHDSYLLEADDLKRKVIEYEKEKKDSFKHTKENAKCLMSDNIEQIKDNDIAKIKKIKINQLEMDKMKYFAKKKRNILQMRAEKEFQIKKHKQEQLGKIVIRLRQELESKIDDENQRLESTLIEKKAKDDENEFKKTQKLHKIQLEIEEYRKKKMNESEKKKKSDDERSLKQRFEIFERNRVFYETENKKRQLLRNEAKQLQNFIINQQKEKHEKEMKLISDRKTENIKFIIDQKANKLRFEDYSNKVIGHYKKYNKTTFPIIKSQKNILKNLDTRKDCNKSDIYAPLLTAKRLGFIWSPEK